MAFIHCMFFMGFANAAIPQNLDYLIMTPVQLAYVLIETILIISIFLLLCRQNKSTDVYVSYSGSEVSTSTQNSESECYDLEK